MSKVWHVPELGSKVWPVPELGWAQVRERKQLFGSVVFLPRILQAFGPSFGAIFEFSLTFPMRNISLHVSAEHPRATVSECCRVTSAAGARPCCSRRIAMWTSVNCNVDQCQTWVCDTTLPLRLSACVCVRHIGLWCHNTREQLAPSAASVAGTTSCVIGIGKNPILSYNIASLLLHNVKSRRNIRRHGHMHSSRLHLEWAKKELQEAQKWRRNPRQKNPRKARGL